jgi:hypothetical protein
MKKTFEKLPAVKSGCGLIVDLPMEMPIKIGFGVAGYSRDGEILFHQDLSIKGYQTVADVEKLALADPDHDWRIFFFSPLYEAEYQRQGDGVWVMVKKEPGLLDALIAG